MRNEIASFLAASFGLPRETGDFRGATAVLEVYRSRLVPGPLDGSHVDAVCVRSV